MTTDTWIAIGAIATSAASILSACALGAIAYQGYWQRRAVRSSAVQNVGSEVLLIGRWLAERPERVTEVEKPEEEDTPEGQRVAVVLADFMSTVMSQEYLLPDDHLRAWTKYFIDSMQARPQLRKFLREHPGWYLRSTQTLRYYADQRQLVALDAALGVSP
ncbi:hypothetical protein ACFYUD_31440 [Nocardia tengchongensis]|uniref:hypothetical protein n=1 Tax=Nocardia tengchongensis TaxID=2055889 RepID=UPI00369779D2